MKRKNIIFCLLLLLFPSLAISEDALEIQIVIKDHHFIPHEITAPAGKKLKLMVHNTDKTIEEFESLDFHREKIVPPGKTINIILAPLKPGRYNFFGEFHQDTAKGVLIIE